MTPSVTELTSKPINTVKRALSRINKKSKPLKGRGNVKSLISPLKPRRKETSKRRRKNVKKLKKFVNKIAKRRGIKKVKAVARRRRNNLKKRITRKRVIKRDIFT